MKAMRKLLYVIGAVFTVRLVLLGCAPVIGVPSARPISAGGSELALGGGLVAGEIEGQYPRSPSPVAHAYYRRNLNPVELGAVFNLNIWEEGFGAGFFTRVNICELASSPSPVTCGFKLDVGLVYAGFSLPVAISVLEDVWITTQPAISQSTESDPYIRLPIGISMLLKDTYVMDATCGQLLEINNRKGVLETSPLTWYCGGSVGLVFGD